MQTASDKHENLSFDLNLVKTRTRGTHVQAHLGVGGQGTETGRSPELTVQATLLKL